MIVYQISKTKDGRKYWTGTYSMSIEQYETRAKEDNDYIYTTIHPDILIKDKERGK